MKDEVTLDQIEKNCMDYIKTERDPKESRAIEYFLGKIRNLMFIEEREGREVLSKEPRCLSQVFDILVRDNIETAQKRIADILFYKNESQIYYLGNYISNIPTYFMEFQLHKPYPVNETTKYGLIEMYYKVLYLSNIPVYKKTCMLDTIIRDLSNSGVRVDGNDNKLEPKFFEEIHLHKREIEGKAR